MNNKFMDLASFVVDVLKMIVKLFANTDIGGGLSYMTLLVAISLMGIFLGSVIVHFRPNNIKFDNSKE